MSATVLEKAFAAYPSAKVYGYKTVKGQETFSVLKQIIFGDYIRPEIVDNNYVTVTEKGKIWIKVRARGITGYVLETDMQPNRTLEVNFIDVGQGDGCHIVTPDDKHFLVDAGGADNMYRFLKWRFNIGKAATPPPPFTVVISHSDSDHYRGFGKIFEQTKGAKQQFRIEKVYHNGMVETSGSGYDSLGTLVRDDVGNEYITDLCDDNQQCDNRIATAAGGTYVEVLSKTNAPKEALRYGSAPIHEDDRMRIEVVGPVAQDVAGKAALPVFDSNKGKTKNGHSVILRLTMGNMRMLLGGDLNTWSEDYLVSIFSGKDIAAIRKELRDRKTTAAEKVRLQKEYNEVIDKCRKVFESDIAKSCHHGSADFTSEFLKVVNPIATVISSGDDEPHCHPRPDTLGTIGKHSRGEKSLIFSTELARSGKEFLDLTKLDLSKGKKKERLVTVYGMINVRTDGEKAIIAQKLERRANGRDWDIHQLEWNKKTKEFDYIDKHAG